MRERLKRRELSTITGILIIIGLFAGIVFITGLMNFIAYALNFHYIEYIEYVLFIIIGIIIIRKWITEYEYILVDEKIFADRYLGKNPKRLFEIKLCSITYIGKTLPADYKGKKQRLTYKAKRSGVVYIIYKSGGDKKCVYFSPTSQMADLLQARSKKS